MQNKAKLFGFEIRKSLLRVWIIVFVLVILFSTLIFILYSKGYRLQNNLTIGHLGKIEMTLPMINTSIIVDENKKIVTTKDNEQVIIPLSPNTHSIIISHDGYFPWMKKFTIPSNGSVEINPMFITQNATGEIITQNDPKYWEIKNTVQTKETPTKDNPEISSDGKTSIWLENNAVMAKIGGEIHTVVQPDTIIKNLQFYKNRSDVVIFSTYNTVYAIEISAEGIQNFMPIYKGTDPYFVESDPNFIYVLDGNLLMAVVI